MDLSVSATTASYLPQQAYSRQGGSGARVDAVATAVNAQTAVATNTVGQPGKSQSDNTGTQTATTPDKQAQEAGKKNPAAEVTAKPGYAFEVDQQNHKIMKVSDAKGVLIYQVPSKGQLALVEAEESAQKRIALTA